MPLGQRGPFLFTKKVFAKMEKAFPPNTILEGTLFKEVVVFTNDKKTDKSYVLCSFRLLRVFILY